MCAGDDWYVPEVYNLKFRMPDREFQNEAQCGLTTNTIQTGWTTQSTTAAIHM
jgi:hypothetical protein